MEFSLTKYTININNLLKKCARPYTYQLIQFYPPCWRFIFVFTFKPPFVHPQLSLPYSLQPRVDLQFSWCLCPLIWVHGFYFQLPEKLFYSSCESPGFSFSLFYITSLKRIPQTLFTHNFGDIRGKSVTEVIKRVSLKGVSWSRSYWVLSHFG